jgi:hypothetical protein
MFDRLFASYQRPCFKKSAQWDTLKIDLSGNQFEITLPPQDYDFPEDSRSDRINLYEEQLYNYKTEPDRNGYPPSLKGVSRSGLFRRNWFSYGSIWRADHIGTLQCSSVICDISRMTPDLNCFNPEHLEKLILHELYYTDGPGFGLNEHTSPVNWKVRSIHGTEWVYLESWSRTAKWEPYPDEYEKSNFDVALYTPLFQDKYLMVTFYSIGSLPADASNRLMFQRIEAIIASLKLQLSPSAVQQKTEAEQRNPKAHYSPHREPEPWQYYTSYRDGNILEGEKSLVIEGPCSPPPPLD